MKSLTIFSGLLGLSLSSITQATLLDAKVEADFKQCATQALSDQNMQANKVVLQTKGRSGASFDHDDSYTVREYKMDLSTRAGDKLGTFTCKIDQSGVLEAIKLS